MIFVIVIVLCYLLVELIKKTKLPNEALPLISAVLGILLSVGGFYVLPELVPELSMGMTVLYGCISGLAATGGNQVIKQAIEYFTEHFKSKTKKEIHNNKDNKENK